MHFCTNCHNMYYLKISDNEGEENALIYYCRNCGNEDKSIIADNVCVSETQLRRSEQKFTFMVNEYTKYDPTLPRINMIKCPNQECSSNTAAGGAGSKVVVKKMTAAQIEKLQKKIATVAAQAAQEQGQAQGAAAQAQEQQQVEQEQQQVEQEQQQVEQEQQQQTALSTKDMNQREVIYIRYDDINMKYIYLCVHCDTIWKTDNRM